jgi:hypothetical protein
MSEPITNVIDGVFVGALLGILHLPIQLWSPAAFALPTDMGFYLYLAVVAAAISGGMAGLRLEIREAYLGGAVAGVLWIGFLAVVQLAVLRFAALDVAYGTMALQVLFNALSALFLGIVANLLYTRAARRLWP